MARPRGAGSRAGPRAEDLFRATGRHREFFDCLANSYGDVMTCGNRHLED